MNTNQILPPFADEVYENLPDTLADLCMHVPGSRGKKDVYLVSSLGVLSALFPNVRFPHGIEWYSPHLYVLSTAPAGAGKGVTRMSDRLADAIDNHIRELFENEHANWVLENQEGGENPTNPINLTGQFSRAPEPKEKLLRIGANTTSAALIVKLAYNPEGVLLFSTEADSLSRSNSQREHGDFSDILRLVYHHEYLQVDRKGDGTTRVPEPRMALVLCGTIKQLPRFVNNNTEDGLLSRLTYYEFTELPEYESQKPTKLHSDFRDKTDAYAKRLLAAYKALQGRIEPLYVVAGDSYWLMNDFYCSEVHKAVRNHANGALLAIANRMSLIAYRIASIFTLCRHIDNRRNFSDVKSIEIAAQDAETAFRIASTCATHLLHAAGNITTSLRGAPDVSGTVGGKELTVDQKDFLEALPTGEFTTSQLEEVAEFIGVPRATANRWIVCLPGIERVRRGIYRKNTNVGLMGLVRQTGENHSQEATA